VLRFGGGVLKGGWWAGQLRGGGQDDKGGCAFWETVDLPWLWLNGSRWGLRDWCLGKRGGRPPPSIFLSSSSFSFSLFIFAQFSILTPLCIYLFIVFLIDEEGSGR
jgi:hypothetical protein